MKIAVIKVIMIRQITRTDSVKQIMKIEDRHKESVAL